MALMGVCTFGWQTGLDIPHAPGRARHHGLDVQGHDILIVGKIAVHLTHGAGEGVVPTVEFALCDDVRFLHASGKSTDQCLLQPG